MLSINIWIAYWTESRIKMGRYARLTKCAIVLVVLILAFIKFRWAISLLKDRNWEWKEHVERKEERGERQGWERERERNGGVNEWELYNMYSLTSRYVVHPREGLHTRFMPTRTVNVTLAHSLIANATIDPTPGKIITSYQQCSDSPVDLDSILTRWKSIGHWWRFLWFKYWPCRHKHLALHFTQQQLLASYVVYHGAVLDRTTSIWSAGSDKPPVSSSQSWSTNGHPGTCYSQQQTKGDATFELYGGWLSHLGSTATCDEVQWSLRHW